MNFTIKIVPFVLVVRRQCSKELNNATHREYINALSNTR